MLNANLRGYVAAEDFERGLLWRAKIILTLTEIVVLITTSVLFYLGVAVFIEFIVQLLLAVYILWHHVYNPEGQIVEMFHRWQQAQLLMSKVERLFLNDATPSDEVCERWCRKILIILA